MNATAIYYLACNTCSIAMTDVEVPVDPKVEENFNAAGRLFMGTARTVNYMLSCDFCGSASDYMLRWDRWDRD